ncbi:serine protease [Hymenobacter tibetensis]|uniref:Serine protease n=1 Tax=Hymenobacter tibetensis TaxID=497967 RepID=A0ABY4CWC2_9BACT|nr:trypsin-like peptidase domain-containing protein [Hymenobacter tibetensis]UOG74554.1 serine protease [Hymenobacter tibetensis]
MYRSPNRYVKWLTLYVREAVPSATPESLTLSADYIKRNTVTSSLFIYPQVIRHKKARIKYDYAFIRISETAMQRLRPGLLPATIATTPPVLTDSLYLIGYPDSKLTSLSYAPGRWAVAPEENDATLTDLTRMWYVTDALTDGASGSPLLQIRDGKAVLVGVHTDGAADPPYKPGNKTAGVTNWTKFNEDY